MANKLTKKDIVIAIAEHILTNGPVTHTQLEARARTRAWFTLERFDAVMETIHRHPQVSSRVKDGDVYYQRKRVVSRAKASTSHLEWIKNNYPAGDEMMGIHPIFEDYDIQCNCEFHLSRDQLLEYRKRKEHHRYCNRHPVRAQVIKNLYNKYYGRESGPDENNQSAPGQGSLLLA